MNPFNLENVVRTLETKADRTCIHWGWLVVLSSFYCVALVAGVGYITGILMDSLKTDLDGNIATISVTGSLQV